MNKQTQEIPLEELLQEVRDLLSNNFYDICGFLRLNPDLYKFKEWEYDSSPGIIFCGSVKFIDFKIPVERRLNLPKGNIHLHSAKAFYARYYELGLTKIQNKSRKLTLPWLYDQKSVAIQLGDFLKKYNSFSHYED